MNITTEDPEVTHASLGQPKDAPKKGTKLALLVSVIAVGALAAVKLDAADSPAPSPMPSITVPTADAYPPPVEIFPGCLNDIECYGQ